MAQSWNSRRAVRVGTWVFPPAGLILLWRSSEFSIGRKLFGTLGVLLISVVWSAAVIFLMVQFCGLQVEFRGGLIPALTFHKTLPNYAALERSRAQSRPSSLTAGVGTNASSYWNGFRGPRRDGIYDEQPIRREWPREGLKPLWAQPIGGGYASFAIAGGRAFTIEQRRQNEAIVAYEVATGRELWTNAWAAEFQEILGGDGPRATPATADGLVYGLGALGEFRCLKAETGETLWRRNVIDENRGVSLAYGMAASPLVFRDKVIVVPGGSPGKSVVAYDRLTGGLVWHSQDDEAAYSSPMVMKLAGAEQVIVVSEKRAMGLDPVNGQLLWQFPWIVLQGNRNIAQPVPLGTNRIFLSGGYGTGCVVFEVTRDGNRFSTRELWRNKLMKNKFTSSVYRDGAIYGLDEDILTCLDAGSGARVWKEVRYGYGQVLLAGDQLIVLCGDGDLAIVRADRKNPAELCRFNAIHGKTWNQPSIAGGYLLVRNAVEMACFRIRPE